MDNWEKEFDAARQYILQSPLSAEHPAIVAALNGIDQEVKRRHRDSKLHQKFSNISSTTANSNHAMIGDEEMDVVKVEVPSNDAKQPQMKPLCDEDGNVGMADDWQDIVVEDDVPKITENDDEASSMGTEMAKTVISLLASHQVLCGSTTAALAAAFHAVMLQCEFICTGVPEIAPPVGGFAAPIRDLPVGQFLPPDWEGRLNVRGIQLRYRNQKVSGSYVLSVNATSSPENNASDSMMEVSLTGKPLFSSVDPFQFSVSDHVNLNSWTVAQQKSSGKISPVLHFKALAPILVKFMQCFHLEAKKEEKDGTVHTSETFLASRYIPADDRQPESWVPSSMGPRSVNPDLQIAEQMRSAVVEQMRSSMTVPQQGDFDGDLHPLGGLYPRDGMMFPGGNLMGPNHPMFGAVGTPSLGQPSGGMHPRFDPFGPPGGPTEPLPPPFQVDPPGKAPTFPAGGTGNPNNDLAIPPPFGGNNMFL